MDLNDLIRRPAFLPMFSDWKSIRSTRIGITGHRGLLGSILTERFNEHGIEYVTYDGDVTDSVNFSCWIRSNQPLALFHLAAIVPTQRVTCDPVTAMRVNANALLSIAESTIPTGDSWVFFASSSHVYRTGAARLKETSPTFPQSLYGSTKLAGEQILLPLMAHQKAKICVGRIFSFFHERQPRQYLVPSLINRIREAVSGDAIEVRDSDAIRDFLHAEMVVDAILALFARRYDGVINIGSGRAMSVEEMTKRIIYLSEKNISVVPLPSTSPSKLVADVTRLKSALSTGASK